MKQQTITLKIVYMAARGRDPAMWDWETILYRGGNTPSVEVVDSTPPFRVEKNAPFGPFKNEPFDALYDD